MSARLRPGSAVRLLLAGLGVAAVLLGVMELAARFVPLERFERTIVDRELPVFVLDAAGERFVTSPHFERYMARQSFAASKPEGVTRVFLLGASAVLGWPAEEECGTSGFLRRALERAYPGRFEVVNAAAMSYGSHRVLDVLGDIVELDPDLVIIWTGNNEYVERNVLRSPPGGRRLRGLHRILMHSRLYRAVRAAILTYTPALVRPAGTDLTNLREQPRIQRGALGRFPEIDRQVLENYRRNLAAMAALLRAADVPAIFCTVPVNLSGWAPSSVPPAFTGPAAAEEWGAQMDAGVDLLDRGEDREAAVRFARVREMTPRYALAAYFQAEALQRLGEFDRGRELFMAARDEDARPLRVLGSFNREIRLLGTRSQGVWIADLENSFFEVSGPALVGMDLFYDYCHPNRRGHALAARALFATMRESLPGMVPPGASLPAVAEECPAPGPVSRAATLYATGLTHSNNGRDDLAEIAYRSALQVRPDFTEALSNLGLLLLKRGSLEEAEGLSRRALEIDPGNPGALLQVAGISLRQGRVEEAAVLGERLLAGNRLNPQALELVGDVALRKEDGEAAIRHYREALSLGAESAGLRLKYGDALRGAGRASEAEAEWRKALLLAPLDPAIRSRLEATGSGTRGGTEPSP